MILHPLKTFTPKNFQAETFAHSDKSQKLYFSILFSLITIFAWQFLQLFHWIQNKCQILSFFTHIDFWIILTIFANFKDKLDRNDSKNKRKTCLLTCQRIKFCNHQRPSDNQVVKIVVPTSACISQENNWRRGEWDRLLQVTFKIWKFFKLSSLRYVYFCTNIHCVQYTKNMRHMKTSSQIHSPWLEG
jgi:hypothetical protein